MQRASICCSLSGFSLFISDRRYSGAGIYAAMKMQRFYVVGTLAWYFLLLTQQGAIAGTGLVYS